MAAWIRLQIRWLARPMAATRAPQRRVALVCGLLATVALMSACNSAIPTTGVMPTATTGAIQLTTDLSSYSVSQAIGVTVTNASAKTVYYTLSGRANCSVIQLDQYVGGKTPWVAVDACTSINPPQVLAIPSSFTEPFSLAPTSSSNTNAWEPGEYRVEMSYSTKQDGVTQAIVAYSAGFTIHA